MRLLPQSLVDSSGTTQVPPSRDDIEREIRTALNELIEFVTQPSPAVGTFFDVEKAIISRVSTLGRLLLVLFLCVRERTVRAGTPASLEKDGRRYQRRPPQARNLNTSFGVVRYFRTYLRGPDGAGFYPLDAQLGLTADRMSMHLLSLATRLATKLSFMQVHATLAWFLGAVPSTEMIERSVLGLGRRTAEWFAQAPAPEKDGDLLVVQIDSKGIPTATDEELARRRGPRRPNPYPESARHRGRDRRERYPSKPRRNKGDKSKNARMATIVVMYTLRAATDGSGRMLGPFNRKVYASLAPKRHAFEIARREATKRGFGGDAAHRVQLITDGDDDLAAYAREYFPKARHTVDVMHVLEYIWKAGECLYREGTDELAGWIDQQKERLYGADERAIVEELKGRLEGIPRTGPGNKGRRERLSQVIHYLEKRLPQMNYKQLLDEDLELGSGAVEGAVKNVIAARFDHGGSRWIRERAEALLQLRCIECNGDWDAFIKWLHDDFRSRSIDHGQRIPVQTATAAPLPQLARAA